MTQLTIDLRGRETTQVGITRGPFQRIVDRLSSIIRGYGPVDCLIMLTIRLATTQEGVDRKGSFDWSPWGRVVAVV